MAATYVYGIIPAGSETSFEVAGLDEGERVRTVPYRDLAAVVSASPRADYRGLQRDEAVHYLTAHQQVVEKVMASYSVLPVKFGTVFPNEAWVRAFLAQGEGRFRAALQRYAALRQMEVMALWSLPEVFREIGEEGPIASLKAEIVAHPDEDTLAQRVALGQMVQASLQQRLAALQDRLLAGLQDVGLDLVVNPLMDDALVLNVALLVDEKRRAALEERLDELDAEFAGRLDFRCVGPLPPYSFATVEMQVPTFGAVEEARRQLGLGQSATSGDIKRAYRQRARQVHPDVNLGQPEAEAAMAELTRAYDFLTAYAEGVARDVENPRGVVCRFDRRAVEGTVLIGIRRQEIAA